MMIDFDSIDEWNQPLSTVLREHVPSNLSDQLVEAKPEYEEDALDLVLNLGRKEEIINATLQWLRTNGVIGYHGTRLTDDEVESVQDSGLLLLKASERRNRLVRALSPSSRWPDVSDRLDAELEKYGSGKSGGAREGQTHLTLSRAGLVKGFNHYIKYGAEFDKHVAHSLLGSEGRDLLAQDGVPRLVIAAVPGDAAIQATHVYNSVEDLRNRDELPNLVTEFLTAWACKRAIQGFQILNMHVDCGMIFYDPVPPEWIVDIQRVSLNDQ